MFKKYSRLEKVAYSAVIVSATILIIFICKIISDDRSFWDGKTDYEVSSQVGDFISGVVGTFLTIAATLFIFLTFREQLREGNRKQFEGFVNQAVQLHRDNVEQLQILDQNKAKGVTYSNRRVFRVIVEQFTECFGDLKKFTRHLDVEEYLNDKYKLYLKKIIKENKLRVSVSNLFLIDFAYSVIFYGLGDDGKIALKRKFLKLIDQRFFAIIVFFLSFKSLKTNKKAWRLWTEIRKLSGKVMTQSVINAYENIRGRKDEISQFEEKIKNRALKKAKYIKYYGGHQHRLGHYYRHLFQSFKFIDTSNLVKVEDKYQYGKLLRSQLSTYEQILLFLNTISHLGRKWELVQDGNLGKMNLISKYQLIKNVPSNHITGISYKSFYPKIKYEYEETGI